MKNVRISIAVVLLVFLTLFGCSQRKTVVHLPELGLSMLLPPGWQVDPSNPRMFFYTPNRAESYGVVEDYPLDGQTLVDYVNGLSGEEGATGVRKVPIKVSGLEAFEIYSEAAYTVTELYVKRRDRVILVSFRTRTDSYETHRPFVLAARQSLMVKP